MLHFRNQVQFFYSLVDCGYLVISGLMLLQNVLLQLGQLTFPATTSRENATDPNLIDFPLTLFVRHHFNVGRVAPRARPVTRALETHMRSAAEAELGCALHRTAARGASELLRGLVDVGARLKQVGVLRFLMAVAQMLPQLAQGTLPGEIALRRRASHAELIHLTLALFIWKRLRIVGFAHRARVLARNDRSDAVEAEVLPAAGGQVSDALHRTKTYGARKVLRDAVNIDSVFIEVVIFLGCHATSPCNSFVAYQRTPFI